MTDMTDGNKAPKKKKRKKTVILSERARGRQTDRLSKIDRLTERPLDRQREMRTNEGLFLHAHENCN